MAIAKLKDGRWIVYYRDYRANGKPYLKREYFGRDDYGKKEAQRRNQQIARIKKAGIKKSVGEECDIKLANMQEFYALHERLRAQDSGRKVAFEVHTTMGFIDALYDDEIVEIKPNAVWHHGFGQLIAYSSALPGRKLRLFIFGNISIGKLNRIKKHCADAGISLTFCGDIVDSPGDRWKRRYGKNNRRESIFLGSTDRTA